MGARTSRSIRRRSAHRARRRDRARRPRGDGRGRLRPVRGASRATKSRPGFPRGGGSNGRTAPSRRCSRRKIRKACAGPQFSAAWLDELAKWRHAEATFDMLQFGLRLGERPRQVITTTPRPIALLKRLMADARTVTTHATSRENAYNLSPAVLRQRDRALPRHQARAPGDRRRDHRRARGRAVDARPRLKTLPRGAGAAVPAHRGRGRSAGLGEEGRGCLRHRRRRARADDGTIYVLADETVAGLSPHGWAMKTIALWRRLEADSLVVEVNQGGDMVRAVIGEADRSRAGARGARDARQMAARRAGGAALRATTGRRSAVRN